MKVFLKFKGLNNSVVLVDPNCIIAFTVTNNQTTLHLTSGQEFPIQDNTDQVMARINNLAGPQQVSNHPLQEGVIIR